MSSYRMVALGTLIHQAKNIRCGSGEYPVLSMTMRDGLVFQDEKFKKVIASADRSDYKVVHRNQLVIGFPIDEGVLATQRIVDEGIVSPAYGIWDIDQRKILPEFLEYVLRCKRALSYYKAKLRGSTARRRSLPTQTLLEFDIPLPDIQEQELILEVLHKVKKIIANRTEERESLNTLTKARFVEMFGDESNPLGWDVVNVEDVATVQVGVVIKPAQYYTDATNGVRAFRSLNIGPMNIKDNDWVYFSEEGNRKNAKSILKENDLLIVRSGVPGTACVVTKQYAGCNAIDIIIAHPDMNKVNPYYLCAYTNLPHGKRQIDEGTGGAAQQHFNVGKYNKLQLMLPPIEKQDEFVLFMDQVIKSKF